MKNPDLSSDSVLMSNVQLRSQVSFMLHRNTPAFGLFALSQLFLCYYAYMPAKLSSAKIARLIDLYKSGKTQDQAALLVGVSHAVANKYLHSMKPNPRNFKHGHTRLDWQSPTYECWANMMKRCYNPKAKDYRWYGAKGIKVCERWHTFANVLADMGEQPSGLMIERINRNGGYEPTNCYWATRAQQQANQTHDCGSRKLTLNQVRAIRADTRSCAK